MLEPKETIIDGKTYIISKFPAIDGREIITQYPLSATPKIGDYQTNKEIMLKIMGYVAIKLPSNNQNLTLSTQDLVNNHVPNWEVLLKLEWAMMEYNCSFFHEGKVSSFLENLVEMLPAWITQMLTLLSEPLSQAEKLVSKS